MIELPFGSGVTAALIFVAFELLVIPVLMESTSKAASLLAHRRAKMGVPIRISSLPYPLWNEGLFSRQRSHILLFVFRMVSIAIPVYLETRIEYTEQPRMETKLLRFAYVIRSEGDSPYSDDNAIDDYDERLQAINTCAYIDSNGWVSARAVNLSYIQEVQFEKYHIGNGSRTNVTADILYGVSCINESEEKLFRAPASTYFDKYDDYVNGNHRLDRNASVLFTASSSGSGFGQELVNVNLTVDVADDIGVECFIGSTVMSVDDFNSIESSPFGRLICHKRDGNILLLYQSYLWREDCFLERDEFAQRQSELKRRLFLCKLNFLIDIEFMEEMRLDAEVMAAEKLLRESAEFYSGSERELVTDLKSVIYRRAENVSVLVEGESKQQRTILDKHILVIGGAELCVILVLALITQACSVVYGRGLQKANTVDGLSQIWYAAATNNGVGSKRIALMIKAEEVDGVTRCRYEAARGEEPNGTRLGTTAAGSNC